MRKSKVTDTDSKKGKHRFSADHLKLLQFLADKPKETFKARVIASLGKFKNGPNITADRIVRNSLRKPVSEGLITLGDRGEYSITSAGLSFLKTYKDSGEQPIVAASRSGTPKRRGRPAKVEEIPAVAAAPKRRGRPPKVKTEEVAVTAEAPKRRGRPPKAKPTTDVVPVVAPKRRGRPPKAKPEPVVDAEPEVNSVPLPKEIPTLEPDEPVAEEELDSLFEEDDDNEVVT